MKYNYLTISVCAAVCFFIGCLNTTSVDTDSQIPEETHAISYIDQLVAIGFNRGDIEKVDEGYLVEGDMLFTISELERQKSISTTALRKTTQDRWDAGGMSIKNLDEVEGIRVRFDNNGIDAVGPNWLAAARQAMNDWNNIQGCAVRFFEVNGPAEVVISARLTASAARTYMFGDERVDSDIELNRNLEDNNGFSYAHKVQVIKHELGHTVNLLHTDRINNGGLNWIHIKGTPSSDNASVFNFSVIDHRPALDFSEGDLVALRNLYPEGPVLCRNQSNELIGQGPTPLFAPASIFQQDGDKICVLSTNKKVYCKDGLHSSWGSVQITNVKQFSMSGDRLAVVMTDGLSFVRKGRGEWRYLGSDSKKIEVDGEYIGVLRTNGNLATGRFKYASSSVVIINRIGTGYIDFEIEGDRAVALKSNGYLYGSDNLSAHMIPLKPNVSSFDIEGNYIGALVNGTLYGKEGLSGTWYQLDNQVSKFQMEGDRIGILVGNTLKVKENGLHGTWIPEFSPAKSFFLKDYYISVVSTGNTLFSKYDMSNSWQEYANNVSSLQQWF